MSQQEKRGHRFERRGNKKWVFPWPVCAKCGLIRLKNEATEKAIKAKCEGDD